MIESNLDEDEDEEYNESLDKTQPKVVKNSQITEDDDDFVLSRSQPPTVSKPSIVNNRSTLSNKPAIQR